MEDPLLPSTTSTTDSSSSSSSNSIVGRVAFLLFLASAALFANYEASKSFEIVVANPSDHSPAASRYRLSFVSNGRATSIVLDATRHVNQVLQLHLHPKKPVRQVTLQLATHNLTRPPVAVTPGLTGPNDYIVSLCPSLFLHKDAAGERSVEAAVRRGMARVSIWDGEGTAPTRLVDALAEVLSGSDAGREPVEEGPCWAEPGFLKYYEEGKSGFLGRLNMGMKEKWRPGVVAEAIGAVAEEDICGAYYSSISATGLDQIM